MWWNVIEDRDGHVEAFRRWSPLVTTENKVIECRQVEVLKGLWLPYLELLEDTNLGSVSSSSHFVRDKMYLESDVLPKEICNIIQQFLTGRVMDKMLLMYNRESCGKEYVCYDDFDLKIVPKELNTRRMWRPFLKLYSLPAPKGLGPLTLLRKITGRSMRYVTRVSFEEIFFYAPSYEHVHITKDSIEYVPSKSQKSKCRLQKRTRS